MSFSPDWSCIPRLAVFVAIGGLAGALYFFAVWRNALALAAGASLPKTLALALLRFVLLGAVLAFASLRGPGPLLAMSAGVLLARLLVVRRLKRETA